MNNLLGISAPLVTASHSPSHSPSQQSALGCRMKIPCPATVFFCTAYREQDCGAHVRAAQHMVFGPEEIG